MNELRELHLRCATGQARTEMWNNKEYLVVPVVALMEGVIHAVNAETPEFVPFETLQKAAESWNGRPITVGHPKKNGTQCSAQDATVIDAVGIGTIRNSHVDAPSKKMLQEAWIEKAKAKKVNPNMYARLEANEREEVSVGALVVTDKTAGTHANGKAYKASWTHAEGDHLAFLPGGRGACSIEMGCGAHRAAMHLVTAEAIVMMPPESVFPLPVIKGLEGESLDQRMQAVSRAVEKEYGGGAGLASPSNYAYPQTVYNDHVVVRKGDKLFSVDYAVKDGEVEFTSEPVEVVQEYVAAAEQAARALAGARHSAGDMKAIQAVHDHAMTLGAACDRGNYKILGDVEGHEFHGNQFTSGGAAASAHDSAASAHEKAQILNQRAARPSMGHDHSGAKAERERSLSKRAHESSKAARSASEDVENKTTTAHEIDHAVNATDHATNAHSMAEHGQHGDAARYHAKAAKEHREAAKKLRGTTKNLSSPVEEPMVPQKLDVTTQDDPVARYIELVRRQA